MALERLAEQAQAVEDAWAAAWIGLGDVAAPLPTYVNATAECVQVCTPGMSDMLLNMVMRFTGNTHSGPVTPADLLRVIAPFRQHRLPFQWWVTVGLDPPGLRDELRAMGMLSWGGSTSMTLPLAGWEPRYRATVPGVELLRATEGAEAQRALRVICEVYLLHSEPMARWTLENPRVRLYYARWNGRPVAALTTLHSDGLALLYNVATLPHARRRGIAGNLAALALRDARDAGCRLAALTATAEARHLYETLGFRSCGTMESWVPGGPLQAALERGGALPGYGASR